MQNQVINFRAKAFSNFTFIELMMELQDFVPVFSEYKNQPKELVELSRRVVRGLTKLKQTLLKDLQAFESKEVKLFKKFQDGDVDFENYFKELKLLVKEKNKNTKDVVKDVIDSYAYLYSISTVDSLVYPGGEYAVCLTPYEIAKKQVEYSVIQMKVSKIEEASKDS